MRVSIEFNSAANLDTTYHKNLARCGWNMITPVNNIYTSYFWNISTICICWWRKTFLILSTKINHTIEKLQEKTLLLRLLHNNGKDVLTLKTRHEESRHENFHSIIVKAFKLQIGFLHNNGFVYKADNVIPFRRLL